MRSAALTPRRVRAFWRIKPLCDHLLMRLLGLDVETYRLLESAGQLRAALRDPEQARERVDDIVSGRAESRLQWTEEAHDVPF